MNTKTGEKRKKSLSLVELTAPKSAKPCPPTAETTSAATDLTVFRSRIEHLITQQEKLQASIAQLLALCLQAAPDDSLEEEVSVV